MNGFIIEFKGRVPNENASYTEIFMGSLQKNIFTKKILKMILQSKCARNANKLSTNLFCLSASNIESFYMMRTVSMPSRIYYADLND